MIYFTSDFENYYFTSRCEKDFSVPHIVSCPITFIWCGWGFGSTLIKRMECHFYERTLNLCCLRIASNHKRTTTSCGKKNGSETPLQKFAFTFWQIRFVRNLLKSRNAGLFAERLCRVIPNCIHWTMIFGWNFGNCTSKCTSRMPVTENCRLERRRRRKKTQIKFGI